MRPFSLIFVMILCVTAQPKMNEFLCHQVFRDDLFDNRFGWNSSKCALHLYDAGDVVDCLDQLTNLQLEKKQLHFAFVGDSRIRVAFLSFWPMLPSYDFVWGEQPIQRKILRVHINLSVYSPTLNTRVSFFWLPKIHEDLLTLLRKWETGEEDAPSVIIIGFGGHHMDKQNPHSNVEYENLLTNLVPLLKSLTAKSLIIWMHQNPIIETSVPGAISQNPTNRKYDGYNVLARRLLKDSGVFYWHSMYPVAEEYVRSCAMNNRNQASKYQSCSDFIHTGYSVVDRGSQVLFNAICNRLLFRNFRSPNVTHNLIVDPKICCSP